MAYEDFFHLTDAPFRLLPDPDYYFPSNVHKEALETMLYSIRAGEGFVQITGNPGVGKTMLIRTLLRQLGQDVALALILNPTLSPNELLRVIIEDLGSLDVMETENYPKEKLLRLFRDFLLEKAKNGIKTIIIVDEAQNLPNETLEELRLLSNLETDKEKLLQIILVGQLELETKLNNPALKQLAQRITIRYRLRPLSMDETAAYIGHRLEVAGGKKFVRFAPRVMNRIFRFSQGIPRLINIICERALMAAFVDGSISLTKQHIEKAAESIRGEEIPLGRIVWQRPLAAVLALGILLYLGLNFGYLPALTPEAQSSKHLDAPASQTVEAAVPAGPVPEAGAPRKDMMVLEKSLNPPAAPIAAEAPPPQEVEVAPEPGGLAMAPPPVVPASSTLPTGPEGDAAVAAKTPEAERQAAAVSLVETTPPPSDEVVTAAADPLALAVPENSSALKVTAAAVPAKLEDTGLPAGRPEPTLMPPPEAFSIPAEAMFLSVDLKVKQGALWRGRQDGAPLLLERFDLEWPLSEGLFILGRDKTNGAFIFSPLTFFKGMQPQFAATLWQKVSAMSATADLLPVLVRADEQKSQYSARSASGINDLIGGWTRAWQAMDLTGHISYYADVFSSFDVDLRQPVIYSRNQLLGRLAQVFSKSGSISLGISPPSCFIDPNNPAMAMAVFQQDYKSQIYTDTGFKILYLKQTQEGSEPVWKITAKIWMEI